MATNLTKQHFKSVKESLIQEMLGLRSKISSSIPNLVRYKSFLKEEHRLLSACAVVTQNERAKCSAIMAEMEWVQGLIERASLIEKEIEKVQHFVMESREH